METSWAKHKKQPFATLQIQFLSIKLMFKTFHNGNVVETSSRSSQGENRVEDVKSYSFTVIHAWHTQDKKREVNLLKTSLFPAAGMQVNSVFSIIWKQLDHRLLHLAACLGVYIILLLSMNHSSENKACLCSHTTNQRQPETCHKFLIFSSNWLWITGFSY